MDVEKRKDVVRMLADVKMEATKKSRNKAVAPGQQASSRKNGGVRLVYMELDSHEALPSAFQAIERIKKR